MNEKNRNIVRANAFGTALDVALGSSDDDFHYQAEHATIAHNAFESDLRLGIKLIFHESGCEVQWAHGKDFSERRGSTATWASTATAPSRSRSGRPTTTGIRESPCTSKSAA